MIDYIYEKCKEHNCAISLNVGTDGAMTITVYGKCTDYLTVEVTMNEELMKKCINDIIRRACYD